MYHLKTLVSLRLGWSCLVCSIALPRNLALDDPNVIRWTIMATNTSNWLDAWDLGTYKRTNYVFLRLNNQFEY